MLVVLPPRVSWPSSIVVTWGLGGNADSVVHVSACACVHGGSVYLCVFLKVQAEIYLKLGAKIFFNWV